ncbi:MAG: hypothetical protein NVSMB3_07120 [Acidobacteriaceae bacterium]
MAGSEYTTEQEHAAIEPAAQKLPSRLLISLAPLAPDALETTLDHIAEALPDVSVRVVAPGLSTTAESEHGPITLVPYTPAVASSSPWILTAADYLNLYELVRRHGAEICVILGSEAQTVQPQAIRALVDAALANADLVTPRYDLRAREGLVNSAILYPVSRALYGARVRFPLGVDLALSLRMAERLATVAQRYTSLGHNDTLIWPVAEAAVAGYTVVQVDASQRSIPQPAIADLNSILALVAGSLFADVEAKAAFWQRARTPQTQKSFETASADEPAPEIQPMLDSFRLAYTNLREIWSLVLPPQSLLGLKKLSVMETESFRMPDALWARTVYDFVLAFRLRTLNRGHLLGALTPLYLAWVASHLNLLHLGTPAERHVEEIAAAFEAEKPYLVSRWRWPDRFNP